MGNNAKALPKKVILQRLFIALVIVCICIIFSLYLFDVISLSILENLKFKIFATVISLSFALIYLITSYASKTFKVTWRSFTLLSLVCEGFGFWWLANPFGYLLIIIGFVFLILGFAVEYRGKSRE
jgi:hypothetical protein